VIELSYKIFSEEMEEEGYKLTATLLRLENSVVAFFDEKGSMKLGTLAAAMPGLSGQTSISSVLLGDRNMAVTKILAGHFSKTFNSIALVSTHLSEFSERKLGSSLLKLAKRLIDKAS
jgi:hypothetical protein